MAHRPIPILVFSVLQVSLAIKDQREIVKPERGD